jgi:heme-degrading monooxygenase HmoA
MTRSLLFLHARPGRGPELLRILERLGVLAMASEQPGFLGVEVAASVDDEDDIVIVGSWASQEHYERWRTGPVPERLLEQIDDLVTVAPVSRVYHIVEAVS